MTTDRRASLLTQTIVSAAILAATAGAPAALQAQARWKQIGTTANGNPVYVDPKSIHRAKGIVSATVRVRFTPPVQTRRGSWASARTMGSVDCAHRTLAAKETIYYGDAKETTVVDRKVNKIPGYGPVLDGSLGAIAVDYLCAK